MKSSKVAVSHVELPTAPEHLSELARNLWVQVIDRALTAERQTLLRIALESLDRADQAMKIVDSEGLVIVSQRSKSSRAHPLLKVEESSRARFVKLWTKLGFAAAGARFIQFRIQ